MLFIRKSLLLTFFCIIVIIVISSNGTNADELIITPSSGPPGTQIDVSVYIKNDVEPTYWIDYYGLNYKIVWNVRPADIINPNLWGFDNPIGTAVIDYEGYLSGFGTIPYDATPGSYYIYAAYQRSPSDPYHMYWYNEFTVEENAVVNDGDDVYDDPFYDPYEWSDSNNPGYQPEIPGFMLTSIILSMCFTILYFIKRNSRY